MNPIKFELNTPQIVRLADPVPDRDGCHWVFQTSDGKSLELPRVAAQQIAVLKVEAGEELSIGRYRQNLSEPAEWVISLTARAEQQRASKEAEAERQAESLKLAERRPPVTCPAPIRSLPDNRGTGTNGPVPRPQMPPKQTARRPLPEFPIV